MREKKQQKHPCKPKMNITYDLNSRADPLDNETFAEYASYSPPEYTPYLSIYESEIMQMAGLTAHWDDKETGGAMFGLFSHAGRPVIMFITGPGPGAVHEGGSFCPDIDFLMKAVDFMKKKYGLQYAGNFHSHHYLQIKGLSSPDIKNTQSIGSKNGYRSLCQIVSTFENKPLESINPSRNQPDNKMFPDQASELRSEITSHRQTNCIKLHPFVYINAAAHSEPQPCSINVIPGTSPIREAICRNPNSLFSKFYEFPLSHIIFDEIEPEMEQECHKTELPVRIQKQILRLPKNVRKNARVSYIDDLIILSLTLSVKEKIFLAYEDAHPHKALSVYYVGSRESRTGINITQETLCVGPHTPLSTIYNKSVQATKGIELKEGYGKDGYYVQN